MDHPTIWKLLDGLKWVQKGRDVLYERMVAGNAPPPKRHKYRQADEHILHLVMDFDNRGMFEYLRGIAHNFAMNA